MFLLGQFLHVFIISLTYYTNFVLTTDYQIHWEVSSWSSCQLNKSCTEPGFKIRSVSCMQNQNLTDDAHCGEIEDEKPESIADCVPEQCVNSYKNRITVARTNWSSCIAEKPVDKHIDFTSNETRKCSKDKILVSFVKTRKSICQFHYRDQLFGQIEAPLCAKLLNSKTTHQERLCYQKCIRRCTLKTWSKWKICKHCRNGGMKYKVREYAFIPDRKKNKADLCPQRVRLKPRSKSSGKTEYQFKLTAWKHVSILYQKKKGRSKFSIYQRNVTCLDKQGQTCIENQETRHISTLRFKIGDRDCQHGVWGKWSECSPQTSTWRKQFRYRDILSYPSGNGKPCDDVRQERKCDGKSGSNDEVFIWNSGNWSPCMKEFAPTPSILFSNNCSVNVRHRNVFCVRKENKQPVQDIHCLLRGKQKPISNSLCKVNCVRECLYSDWSNWSNCQNNNVMERRKENLNKSPLIDCPRVLQQQLCSTNQKNEIRDSDYFWHKTSWSQCEIPNKNKTDRHCLIGTQVRKNVCVESNHVLTVVNDSLCKHLIPDTPRVRKCFICPKKCMLTKWSEWSPPCSAVCNPLDNLQPTFTERRRYIINHGNKLGEMCPQKLHDIKECPNCLDYHWVAEKWDVCTHSAIPKKGNTALSGLKNGYQLRNVYCSNGENIVADSLCRDLKPIEYRECHINWLVCNVKPWSEWSSCSDVCGGGTQERTRSFTSKTCQNNNKLNFSEKRSCNIQPCKEYRFKKGAWGPCHSLGNTAPVLPEFRGVNFGVKYRNVTCQDNKNRIVPNMYCEESKGEKIPNKRRCIAQSKIQCRMSKWSAFTPCSSTCGIGVSMRTRKILMHASPGHLCPPNNGRFVTQTMPCKVSDCFDFKWQTEDWGECKLDDAKCGDGKQYRTVSCTQLSTHKPSSNCDVLQKPHIRQSCRIPCDDDCLLSKWSEWSECSDTRTTNRTRRILRNGTTDCSSPLFEEKRCDGGLKNANWKASSWSSCFKEKYSYGIMARILDCVDEESGETIHPKYCSRRELPLVYKLCEEAANEASHCKLTSWSSWSACGKTCGSLNYRTRERKSNAHCKKDVILKETLKCPVLPCFKLTLGEWSDCKPQYKNTCGEGIRHRDGKCTRDDGNVVDLLYCDDYLTGKSVTTESCNIPCWNDCVLSSWSNWSSCFGQCEGAQILRRSGQQIRSRFIVQTAVNGGRECDRNIEEKKRCFTPKCFSFSWIVRNGQYKCQRSDGLIVSTGCKLLSFMYECDCSIPNADCIQKQYCICDRSYQPYVDGSGKLIRCVLKNNPVKDQKIETKKGTVSISGIVCITFAAFVGYVLLFIVIVFLYKRRNKKLLLRHISNSSTSSVLHATLDSNQNGRNTLIERSRNLIRLSNRRSNSCNGSISYSDVTEETPLSSFQSGVDVIALDGDICDDKATITIL